MDLETPDPTPPPPETPPPAAAAPAPETPPAPPADPVEADAVEVQGGKYVPLEALKAEREKAKTFKDKAQQYDATIQYVNQVRPYIDFLQANPDLMTRPAAPAPTPAAQPQPVDEDAAELARTLDLYTADGQPDIKRAQKLMTVVDKIADAKSDAKVKPLAESTTRERSQHMYQRALATKTPDGRTVDKAVLDAMWARTPPDVTSTEEGATALVMLALGMGAFNGQVAPPQPPATPPVVTERPGGRQPNTAPLTALDERIAGIRNRSAKDWNDLTRSFTAGRTNVLED